MIRNCFAILALLLIIAACNRPDRNILIEGSAKNMNGGMISLADSTDSIAYTAVISIGKFQINKPQLSGDGFFTLSVNFNNIAHEFEVYLEPGSYTIGIPEKEGQYLAIKTSSKMQRDLSTYYAFEDSIMYRFHHTADSLDAVLKDPKTKQLSQPQFEELVVKTNSAHSRERGAETAVINMFAEKHSQNLVIPHIIIRTNYAANPAIYFHIYQNLSPAAKKTPDGIRLGKALDSLNH